MRSSALRVSHLTKDPQIFAFPTARSAVVAPEIEPAPPIAEARPAAPAKRRASPREVAYRVGTLLFLGDWVVATLAILAGLTLREWQRAIGEGTVGGFQLNPSVVGWSLGASTLFAGLLVMSRSYELGNFYRIDRSMKNIMRSLLLWSLVIWASIGLFRIEGFTPRYGIAYSMVTLTLALGLWRLVTLSLLINPKVKRATSSRIVVVGWNEKAERLQSALRMDLAQLGEIVGCVAMSDGCFEKRPPSDLAQLGSYSELRNIIEECSVDGIVLADVSCPGAEIQKLIAFCQREMIDFQMVPDYFPALSSGLQVKTVSGVPLLGVSELPLDKTLNRAIKRSIDIIGALVGICLSALIVPWFCALVYLESPGPMIFRQRRTSRSGRTFEIYKIRSMRTNAESNTGPVWCSQEDPRRLRIGTFMRKWNIDELPQFINVLKGDMSLVGPRPERPELIVRFKDEIPNYNARHEVRGGLTGWAQINGLRGNTDLQKRIEADLYYLENWNPFLDFYCIAATFFKRQGAH